MTSTLTQQKIIDADSEQDVLLSAQGISKKFCRDFKTSLFYGLQDLTQEVLGLRGDKNDQLRKREFWALQNVSFELRRGEALGLVGKNGSGKSTLLRVIAGLIKPDVGRVQVKGRVAPLIALGAGFNPVLTGRENIYANMSILGLSKVEIDERFDEVVAFAEIPDAIDAPVRSYSSGMQARLGFACAIHTEPDILLLDEVLAVGDIKFRGKCHRKLSELRDRGTSFVLVSHQSQDILNVCDQSIYLKRGNILDAGPTYQVMEHYEKDLLVPGSEKTNGKVFLPEKPSSESLGLDIQYVFFRNERGDMIDSPKSGEAVQLCIGYQSTQKFGEVSVYVLIRELMGTNDLILHLSNFFDQTSITVQPGEHEMQLEMPYICLRPGLYAMTVFVKQGSMHVLDHVDNFSFTVSGSGSERNLFYQPRRWKQTKR
ncbi:MAG: ABC transporter ATP-binding protein [Cyanobacteria bacterium P01_G01_bin.38]